MGVSIMRGRHIHVMLGAPLILYCTLLVITNRAISAFIILCFVCAGLWFVNQTKMRVLKEPMTIADFFLLKQIIKHPKFYMPFLGPVKVFLGLGLMLAIGSLMLVWERPLVGIDYAHIIAVLLFSACAALIAMSGPGRHVQSAMCRFSEKYFILGDSERDIHKFGLVGSLLIQVSQFLFAGERMEQILAAEPLDLQPAAPLRNIVAVQCESFFDPRLDHPQISTHLLKCFDDYRGESLFTGRLEVPAWGANTVRTEFSFLTGIANHKLGVSRFNPYLSIPNRGLPSIATILRQRGYRTVCVHPFNGDFFNRAKAIPRLGFDEFIEISAFSEAEKVGPYISDKALGDKIVEILSQSDRPTFIFAITMENHGPWEKDALSDKAMSEFAAAQIEERRAELSANEAQAMYLWQLSHSDRLICRIAGELRNSNEPGLFCFFGDHRPLLPEFSQDEAGAAGNATDYLIWRSGGGKSQNRTVKIEELSRLFCKSCSLD